MNPHAIEERSMLWLMLLAVWGAAAIVVAVIWGRLVHRGQGSDDERIGSPPTADSDARPEVPLADSDHGARAGRHPDRLAFARYE
jgi:hypothetical protein